MNAHSLLPLVGFLLSLASSLTPCSLHSEEPLYSVAVFDFEVSPEFDGKGEVVSTLLTTLLSSNPSLLLVERAGLDKVLGELELTLTGTVDAKNAAKIGHLVGANVLVTGRIFQTGDEIFLAAKAIGTETGRVYGELAQYRAGESMSDAVAALSEKIAMRISEKGATFVAKSESAEERNSRLAKLVEGKQLPSVFINISEEHLSRRIPDPAVQSEIQKTLQDLGFKLVDKSSEAGAVITGEAFSELGSRHANIVSCRARAEVTVKLTAKGSEIQVERETGMAADLAENIAAKTALQKVGSSLAERIVPMLVD